MKRIFCAGVCGLFLFVFMVASCKNKDDHDGMDTQVPVITISAPANNQVFSNGDTVKIQGNVSDNSLHELRIYIRAGATELFSKTISVHNLTTYDFNEGWKSAVSAVTSATVRVEVEDHGDHVVTAEVPITINP